MRKIRRTKLFSMVLMVAFLATSTLTRATAVEDAGDFHSNHALHTKSDLPGSSDQQFPFEEKEKEFEDKTETDDKDDIGLEFASNFFYICEVSHPVTAGTDDFKNLYTSSQLATLTQVPLFLRNSTLLI